MHVALIYMASGRGRRFGSNKLLADLNGRPLYQYGFRALQQAVREMAVRGVAGHILVVSPYQEIRVWCCRRGALVYDNPQADEGIAASIRIGTERSAGVDALAFFVADQPLLRGRTIACFLAGFAASGKPLGAMTNTGRPGNPAVFLSAYRTELAGLRGDTGGCSLLLAHEDDLWRFAVPPEQLIDVDWTDDLIRLKTNFNSKHNI